MSKPPAIPLQRLRELASPLAYWPRTLAIIWAAAPRWTVAWIMLLVIQGLLPAVPVYLTRPLIDQLSVAIAARGAWETLQPVIFLAGVMIGAIGLVALVQGALSWVRTVQAEYIQDHISALVHARSATVDLAFYESPEYFDKLDRARSEASGRALAILENGGNLAQNSLTLLAMGAMLLPYGIWVPLLLFASSLPALYVVLRLDRHYHRWWAGAAEARRRVNYFDMMLTNSASAAELRLFDLGPHFQAAYQELRRRLRGERLTMLRGQNLARLGASLIAAVTAGAAMAWMGWRAIQGMATLGDLALFYQAFQRGAGLMRTVLGSAGQIYSNSLFLSNLFTFLDLQPQISDPADPSPAPTPLRQNLRFKNVTFRYPGSARAALDGFDLEIPAGQVVAVVGENGAGKSTLVKLLCRFYDPDDGTVELDGIDMRALSLRELRRMISVLFQFPIPYHTTATQNIALGDPTMASDKDAIEAAARAAGAHEFIARLPQGYATPLGKWFAAGAELSGGEWQRLAMARAFLRRAPIIALDEPTSFMDSWAEADWFDRFRRLAQGRTALIITHRFTIAMRADVIHVMREGKIVESGTHQDLLSLDGLYAQSWAAQMSVAGESPLTAGDIR